jgi:hypothetical protein
MLRALFARRNSAYADVRQCTLSLRDAATAAAISSIYQKIFGSDPWNEGFRCPVCKAIYPLGHKRRICDACQPGLQVLLVDFWPRHRVLEDFYKEMNNPGARLFLAHADEGIVGFAWGYEVSVTAEHALELDAPGLEHRLHGRHFYIDEVGLLLPYRAKGVGKQLVSHLIEGQEVGRVFYRTLAYSPMHRLGESLGGRVVQHISEHRVIILI